MTRPRRFQARAKAARPRPLFPFAVTLRAVALLAEGNGSPALYIAADTAAGHTRVYRVPEGCQVETHTPRPVEDVAGRPRVFLPAGSAARFQMPGGPFSSLALDTVRLCRELLEAAQALKDAQPGEEKGQGAA